MAPLNPQGTVCLVLGGTGMQGHAVITSLCENNVFDRILFGTRDINSTKSKALTRDFKNVHPVHVNYSEGSSLRNVLKSEMVHSVFAVTDFWDILNRVGDPMQAMEEESKEGIAIVDACIENNVQHLVFSTLENVNRESGDQSLEVPHFVGKSKIEDYLMTKGDKIKYTLVRLAFYYQNFGLFIKPNAQGNYFFPMSPEAKFYSVNVEAAGEAIATMMCNPNAFHEQIIGLGGDYQSFKTYCQEYTRLLDSKHDKCEIVQLSEEEYGKLWPGAKDLAQMFKYITTYPNKSFRDEKLTSSLAPKRSITFKQWVDRQQINSSSSSGGVGIMDVGGKKQQVSIPATKQQQSDMISLQKQENQAEETKPST